MSVVKVYTVRRAYSNGVFTIRVNDKPSILAFKTRGGATQFIALEKKLVGKPQQPLCIDHSSMQTLHRRCSMNALTLTVYEDNGDFVTYDSVQKTLDDMQFHFENVIKYMG